MTATSDTEVAGCGSTDTQMSNDVTPRAMRAAPAKSARIRGTGWRTMRRVEAITMIDTVAAGDAEQEAPLPAQAGGLHDEPAQDRAR